MGTNITLFNGKIQIKPEKWLVPIAKNYPELQKRYTMLEPEKGHHNEGNAMAFSGYSFGLAGQGSEISNQFLTEIINIGNKMNNGKR